MVHNPAHDLFSIGHCLCPKRHQCVQISKSFGLQPVTRSIPITTMGTLYYTVVHIHVYMQNITDICKNKNKKQLKCIAKNHINMIIVSTFKIRLSTAGIPSSHTWSSLWMLCKNQLFVFDLGDCARYGYPYSETI